MPPGELPGESADMPPGAFLDGLSGESLDGPRDELLEGLPDLPPEEPAAAQEDPSQKTRMELYDWLQCVVSAIIFGILIFVFIGRTIGVEGDSMRDTLHWYDTVIMSGFMYTPKNGDIIVFRAPSDYFGDTPLVKRVIAVAGQTIDIDFDTGEVYLDGALLDEPYIKEPTITRLNFEGPVTVMEGHVFVMGDNRNHSSDSRDYRVGQVDTRLILGKVLFIAVPGGGRNDPRNWSRIGFAS